MRRKIDDPSHAVETERANQRRWLEQTLEPFSYVDHMESYSAVLLVSGHDNWPSFKSNLQLQLECFSPRKATFNFHQPCTLPFPRTVTASAVATGHTAPCPISPSYRFPSQRSASPLLRGRTASMPHEISGPPWGRGSGPFSVQLFIY